MRTRGLAVTGCLLLALSACGADPEPTASHRTGGDRHGSGKHQGSTGGTDGPGPSSPGSGGSTPGDGSGTTTVAVYWVGDSPQGPRLFREFRRVPAGDPYAEAVGLLTSGEPLDPDYRSLVTGLDVRAVALTGSTYALTLGDGVPTERPPGMSTADARLAEQQLVYTLQGVGQTRDPVDVDHLYGEAGLVTNANFASTLNLVSVTSPEQGATVGDTFTASGVASSFEATVPWEIRQGTTVVKKGFTTADGWMDKLYPWQTEIDVSDLDPGSYTFVARTDDPSDGEGSGPMTDSKDFTIS